MKEPDITIITPVYYAKDDFLKRIAKSVKEQNYSGKITHIFIKDNPKNQHKIDGINIINNSQNIGLAASLNKGFKIAKTNIVISLMEDCLPSSKKWLSDLVAPFENKNVVATISSVELPKKFWNKFNFLSKIMTAKEQRIITPGTDGKACAYRKNVVMKIGGFDNKTFRTAGEDNVIYYYLKQNGLVINTFAKVYHYHFTTFIQRVKKEIQYNEGLGTTLRNYPKSLFVKIKLYSLIKFLSPILLLSKKYFWTGIIIIIIFSNYDIKWVIKKFKSPISWIISITIKTFIYPLVFYGFWKGFLSGKQRI